MLHTKETAREELERRLKEIKDAGREFNAIEGLRITIPRVTRESIKRPYSVKDRKYSCPKP